MKTGIVLEGGAMRGMYTAGVLDVLMENGVDVDMAVGVSAGATFGINYKSKQIGRTIRYNTKYCKDPRYGSVRSLLKTGDMFDADFCYDELPFKLDVFDMETFKKDPLEFFVVSTDVNTGKAVYTRFDNCDKEDLLWLRASASMPLVSKIVSINGGEYLDGGIADSIPVRFCMNEAKCDKAIVVLTRVWGYRKEPAKLMGVMKLLYKKYPKFVEAMKNRHINYNESLDEVERLKKEGKVFLLSPSRKVKLSKTESDPEKLREMYNLGREDAMKSLADIKTFLG